MVEHWYRYDNMQQINDPYGEGPGETVIFCLPYRVKKTTAKGVWLDLSWNKKRFVLRDARKRWACPTKEEALVSFRARKAMQRAILTGQLKNVEAAIELAEAEVI